MPTGTTALAPALPGLRIINRADGATGGGNWSESFQGRQHGAGLSVILVSTD